jgi:hypothetical protein
VSDQPPDEQVAAERLRAERGPRRAGVSGGVYQRTRHVSDVICFCTFK